MKPAYDPSCPIPITPATVQPAHGGGGRLMRRLLETVILPTFPSKLLAARHDSAVFPIGGARLAFTTDSYVVTPRFFSQALLGFVTLSALMMADDARWALWLGLEDPRTVVAHEIAHQWWGHQVGWQGYRDQWLSEAMANYAAVLYGRNELGGDLRFAQGPTSGWQESLLAETEDGRPIESLGPLVLGARLISSRSVSETALTALTPTPCRPALTL